MGGLYGASSFMSTLLTLGMGFILLYETIARRRREARFQHELAALDCKESSLRRDIADIRDNLANLTHSQDTTAADPGHAHEHGNRKDPPLKRAEAEGFFETLIANSRPVEGQDAPGNTASARSPTQQSRGSRTGYTPGYAPGHERGDDTARWTEISDIAPPDTGDTDDFSMFTDSIVTELLHDRLARDQVELFAQPVVKLPSRRHIATELLARLRAKPGVYLPANKYMHLARKEELAPKIDNALLMRCIQVLNKDRKHGHDIPYFLNITSRTLQDKYFMADLAGFLREHNDMARNIIFEMSQTEYDNLESQGLRAISTLARAGCRFSMDHVTSPRLKLSRLRDTRIRYVKLDGRRMYQMADKPGGIDMIRRFKARLEAAKIRLIVERIENEDMMRDLLDFEVDYGQGFLFGKPDHWAAYDQTRRVA
jgi:cyclic-di-GMP phosphodiesterase TipF (flagellum assembly factor)